MKTSNTLGILLMAIAVLAMAPAAALAQQSANDPDAKCLKCHSKKLKKTLEDGETMFLQVSADDFGQSVHRVIGCTGCHRDVPKGKHPSRQPISSQRDYSLKHNDTCRQCHAAKYTDYKHSVHASLVAEGDARAPVCSDCHSAHAIQERAVYEPVSGEPCSKCHGEIYDAYAQSVHGLARANGNVIREDHIQAPICADCHKSHDVDAVAASDYLRSTCLDCHDGAAVAHEKWLPNATGIIRRKRPPEIIMNDALFPRVDMYRGAVRFTMPRKARYTMELIDSQGATMFSSQCQGHEWTVPVWHLHSGSYFAHIRALGSKGAIVKRFVYIR